MNGVDRMTEGPWTFMATEHGAQNKSYIMALGEKGARGGPRIVAQVMGADPYIPAAEIKANGDAIAAVPEMIAAVTMWAHIYQKGTATRGEHVKAEQLVMAAIVKLGYPAWPQCPKV